MWIIYCFRHKGDNKLYIGKTSKTLSERVVTHLRDAKDGTYFHKALLRYGIGAFDVRQIDSAEDEEELSSLERFYIDMFSTSIRKCGYNNTHGGDGVELSYEARKKMAKTKTGVPSKRKGVPMSRKAYSSLMASRIGIWDRNRHPRIGVLHTEETKNKIRETKAKNTKSFEKHCEECGAWFISHVIFAKFCSNKCKLRSSRKRKLTA